LTGLEAPQQGFGRMSPHFFIRGLVIGLSIAAPVGPIGVLCIRRSLRDGARYGFAAGMGAATADAAYGCVAGFGLTAVSGFLTSHAAALRIVGGVFLCYLGIKTFLSRPREASATPGGGSRLALYGSTLLLTLANPATILSFAVVFAALGLGKSVDYPAAGWLVAGVFTGSAAWWLLLSSGVGLLRSRLDAAWIRSINWVSGAILVTFGIYALSLL
jgi:threonine/homoserine/homoserine lactone efflux protein